MYRRWSGKNLKKSCTHSQGYCTVPLGRDRSSFAIHVQVSRLRVGGQDLEITYSWILGQTWRIRWYSDRQQKNKCQIEGEAQKGCFNFFDLLRGAQSFKAHRRRATELSTISCRQNTTALDHINCAEFSFPLTSSSSVFNLLQLPWKESFKWDRLLPRPHTNGKLLFKSLFPISIMMNFACRPYHTFYGDLTCPSQTDYLISINSAHLHLTSFVWNGC